jgi:hypothetical protein
MSECPRCQRRLRNPMQARRTTELLLASNTLTLAVLNDTKRSSSAARSSAAGRMGCGAQRTRSSLGKNPPECTSSPHSRTTRRGVRSETKGDGTAGQMLRAPIGGYAQKVVDAPRRTVPQPRQPRGRRPRAVDEVRTLNLGWIPAFAGMTNHGWIPAFAGMTGRWIPAFAGMTGRCIPAFAGMTRTPACAGMAEACYARAGRFVM